MDVASARKMESESLAERAIRLLSLSVPPCAGKRPKQPTPALLANTIFHARPFDTIFEEAFDVSAHAQAQLSADRARRRREGSNPTKRLFFIRAMASILVVCVLRLGAGRVSLVEHEEHNEHDADVDAHDEAVETPWFNQMAGINKDGNIWVMHWMLLMVLGLMGATVLFEKFKDWLEEALADYSMVLGHLWSELTVLGFLALCTFIMIQGGVLPAISMFAFGEPHYLVHLFEVLHFMLFFVLLGFLFLALWLLFAMAIIEKQQRAYEAFLNFYRNVAGTQGFSLPQALGMRGRSKTDPLIVESELALGASIVESELAAAEATLNERSCLGKLRALVDPFDDAAWELCYVKRLAAYQRLRHRFILSPSAFGRDALPSNFEFSNYLLRCAQGQLSDIITLGPTVWLRGMALAVIICEVAALATELEEFGLGAGFAQNLLIAVGWGLLVQACLVSEHYMWVSEQLVPVQVVSEAQEEVARLRTRSWLWGPIYDYIQACLHPATRIETDAPTPEAASSRWMPRGLSQAFRGARSGWQKMAPDLGMKELLGSQKRWSYEPGEFMRRAGASFEFGDSKHTSLFFLKERVKRLERVDLYEMKQSAQRPAQQWVQSMLVLSSLHITINLVFCHPESVWDWKIALGIFPVVVMMLFHVPDTVEPMITSLSIEMLTDVKAVQAVLYDAKLRRFAHAAKLLQALRSRTRKEKKARQGAKLAPPQTLRDLMEQLPPNKRMELVHLKETFDLFNVDNDNTLQPEELCSVLLATKNALSRDEVKDMIEDMDTDGDGAVSFVEFAAYVLTREKMPAREAAESIFATMDTDHSGVLSVSELRRAFKNLRSGLDEDELMDIISVFDVGSTGRVEKSEFVEKLVQIFEDKDR